MAKDKGKKNKEKKSKKDKKELKTSDKDLKVFKKKMKAAKKKEKEFFASSMPVLEVVTSEAGANDSPAANDAIVADDILFTDNTPTADEILVADDTPVADEISIADNDEPIIDESLTNNINVIEETPVDDDESDSAVMEVIDDALIDEALDADEIESPQAEPANEAAFEPFAPLDETIEFGAPASPQTGTFMPPSTIDAETEAIAEATNGLVVNNESDVEVEARIDEAAATIADDTPDEIPYEEDETVPEVAIYESPEGKLFVPVENFSEDEILTESEAVAQIDLNAEALDGVIPEVVTFSETENLPDGALIVETESPDGAETKTTLSQAANAEASLKEEIETPQREETETSFAEETEETEAPQETEVASGTGDTAENDQDSNGMLSKPQMAAYLFQSTYNCVKCGEGTIRPSCAQAMLLPYEGELGLDEEQSLSIGRGFAMGMMHDSTCGALVSAIMMAGLAGASLEDTSKIYEEFQKRYGSTLCKDILEGPATCRDIIKNACLLFEEHSPYSA